MVGRRGGPDTVPGGAKTSRSTPASIGDARRRHGQVDRRDKISAHRKALSGRGCFVSLLLVVLAGLLGAGMMSHQTPGLGDLAPSSWYTNIFKVYLGVWNFVPAEGSAMRLYFNGLKGLQQMQHPKRNRRLEARLEDMIRNAEKEARLKGLYTETAAYNERQQRRKDPDANTVPGMKMLQDAVQGRRRKVVLCYEDADCGRGICVASKCSCAAGYAGTQCSRPIYLIVEKEEKDIETQRHVVLPLGGTDFLTDKKMYSNTQEQSPLHALCHIFYSWKEYEVSSYNNGENAEIFVLYPGKGTEQNQTDDDQDMHPAHVFAEHIFGSTNVTYGNIKALETLFTALRACLSVQLFPGDYEDSLLHTYVLNHLPALLFQRNP